MPTPLSSNLDWNMAKNLWAQNLNGVLALPILSGNMLDGVSLANGVTIINHGLGRKMTGWIVADKNSAAQIYRSQPFNSTTLTLTSNAICVVNLWVF